MPIDESSTKQIDVQPLPPQLQQQILGLRDDVVFYSRRLEEAQMALNKGLTSAGLREVNLLVVVPIAAPQEGLKAVQPGDKDGLKRP